MAQAKRVIAQIVRALRRFEMMITANTIDTMTTRTRRGLSIEKVSDTQLRTELSEIESGSTSKFIRGTIAPTLTT